MIRSLECTLNGHTGLLRNAPILDAYHETETGAIGHRGRILMRLRYRLLVVGHQGEEATDARSYTSFSCS